MAKRKGLLEQLWDDHKKRQRERERELARQQKANQVEQRRLQREYERDVAARERAEAALQRQSLAEQRRSLKEAERREAEEARLDKSKRQQAEQAQRLAAAAIKRADAEARRTDAIRKRDQKEAHTERMVREAQERTAMLEAASLRISAVLVNRGRQFGDVRDVMMEALSTVGSVGVETIVKDLVNASEISSGFGRIDKCLYRDEAFEMILDYELPGQKVVPLVNPPKYGVLTSDSWQDVC